MSEMEPMVSVEFEVFGKVQGLLFTKYCKEMCEELNLYGWVKNTKRGTILGKLQGKKSSVDQMINWLSNIGSPGCAIEHCELTNWQNLVSPDYRDFAIRF